MKTFLTTSFAILLFTVTCNAQWTASGTDIYNSNTGNVGIATTAPEHGFKLDVNGLGAIGSQGSARIYLGTTDATHAFIQSRNTSVNQGLIFYASSYNFSTGNVGIGTATPDQLLTVNGTVHAKSVVVDLTIVPDYVFKPTYKLPSLDYVKNYVEKNSHLPEVPSEAEIKKNGLNVGEMNAILLKKVEELTLYVLELNKTVKAQEKEIKKLKKTNLNRVYHK